MFKKIQKKFLIIALIILNIMIGVNINASDVKSANGVSDKIGYTLKAQIPSNQVDKGKTYFYLKVKPTTTQVIQVDVVNNSNRVIKLNATLNVAMTNQNGVIVYDGSLGQKFDPSLQLPITDVVKIQNPSISVNPGQIKKINLKIDMKKKSFTGIIVGGINFKEEIDESKENSKEFVKSRYGYNIGLVLTQSNQKQLEKSDSLIFKGIRTEIYDGSKVTMISFLNEKPAILSKLNYDIIVKDIKSGKVVLESKTADMAMAPNTKMDYHLNWGKRNVEPGKYTAVIEASSGKNKWSWQEDFEIDADVAKEVNDKSVNKILIPLWYRISFGVLLVGSIGSSGFIIYRKRKMKRGNDNV